jgi:hypothetical protein
VNHVLCWANGCESCCAMLSQWVWFMVRYAEQLVVNHGVLYRPKWLWIIVWYAEPSGCESCVILSQVVVNHVVLYWASGCESFCGGCESCCVILSQVVVNHVVLCWVSSCESTCVMLSRVVVNHGVLCLDSGCKSWCTMLSQSLWITLVMLI